MIATQADKETHMSKTLVKKEENPDLPALPTAMLTNISALTNALGVPREVLASDDEIEHAWNELPRELKVIPIELRGELVARMCVAVSTGLFDGAINYIWNASVINLREKIISFGLPVVAQIIQKDFEKTHLFDLQDSQLLSLCLKLNLIDEDGYFFLDQCRDVRNNFSAAHPSLGKINDREFTLFLNRCARYALAETVIPKGVDISAFITAIKGDRFNKGQCDIWVKRLSETHDAQRQMLIEMTHGVYCDPKSSEPTRLNAFDLCQELKKGFSSELKSNLINQHSEYLAKGEEDRHKASQQFFEKLGLIGLLNEAEQHLIFSTAINNLLLAHKGMNNFYNEPPFAKRLLELSSQEQVPETAQDEYVKSVAAAFIGNGYGVSTAAIPHYSEMIEGFSPREVSILLHLHQQDGFIKNRIKSSQACKKRFKKAVELIEEESVPSSVKIAYKAIIES